MKTHDSRRYEAIHMDEIPPIPCPCGLARRAFTDSGDGTASLHIVEIKRETETHYHKRMTEIYYILEGEGHVELDGEKVPVRPGSSVLIRPGCRHRAVGNLKIVNTVVPAFDPRDEWIL